MYSKTNTNYLGSVVDMAQDPVDGFYIEDTIHIIWNLGSDDERIDIKLLSDIIFNIDDYMWTPFAIFAATANRRDVLKQQQN